MKTRLLLRNYRLKIFLSVLLFLFYVYSIDREFSPVAQVIYQNITFQNDVIIINGTVIRSLGDDDVEEYERETGDKDDESCTAKGINPLGKVKIRKDLDIFAMESLNFLLDYKNPCFLKNATMQKETIKGNVTSVENVVIEKLFCLPYFFIIGMPKSGTSDLWDKLSAHPDVEIKHRKEPMFFNRKRFGKYKFEDYLGHFSEATKVIERKISPCTYHPVLPYHHVITGEGTVDVSFDNSRWRQLPGNEGCSEPRYTNPHYVHHILPDVKLIAMMRDPVERIFSDYMYESQFFGYKKSIEDFHISVLESMKNHLDCRRQFTVRACAYNHTIESFKARLRVGLYYIFLKDWLKVFPREQFLFLQFENYTRNRKMVYNTVLQYLNLRPLTQVEITKIFRRPIPNTRSPIDRELGDMMNMTRYLLKQFYKPFNKRLANLLQDNTYRWE